MALCVHCATPLPDGSRFCSHCGTPVPGHEDQGPTLSPQGKEIFDRLGDVTAGRYDVLRELGRGGMAIVFLAFQQSLDRQIAIKVLLPFLAYDTELVERFLREARTQGKLDHPCIIKVYEVHSEGGLTFFTMPYVSGRSLRTLLLDDPQPPLAQVHRYLCQAADALSYAHRRGVIHRDVKPDNMVLDEERDCVIITDFGIAKALAAETTLTTPGDLLGTPQYMSPEQGEGRQDLDGRADQYSLGLIGYEMLAGQRAFHADNLAELMYKHRFEEPEGLDKLRPDAPWSLRHALMRTISKDREDRFPTMDGFLSALEACTAEIQAMGEDRTEPMPPPGSGDTTLRVPTPPGRMHPGRTPTERTPLSPVPRSRAPSKTPPAWSRTPPARTPPTPPARTPPPPAAQTPPPPAARTPTPPAQTPPPPAQTPTPPVQTPTPPARTPTPPGRTPTPPAPPREPSVLRALDETTPPPWSTPDVDVSWSSAEAPTVTPQPSAPAFPGVEPRQRRRGSRGLLLLGVGAAAAAAVVGLSLWGPLRPVLERTLTRSTGTTVTVPDLVQLPPEEREPPAGAQQPTDELVEGGEAETQVAGVTGEQAGQETPAAGGEARPGAAGGETETTPPADEPPREDPKAAAAAALAAARTAALTAQRGARSAQGQAEAARADELFEQEYANLGTQLRSADRAMTNQQYEVASTRYSNVARAFTNLAQRGRTALAGGGADALAARRAMEEQRDSAIAAGARERAPGGLTSANIVANRAADEFNQGNYTNAATLYREATDLFASVLATATAQVSPEQQPTERQQAGEQAADTAAAAEQQEPPPEEEAVVEVPAEQLVTGMVERFRELFEAEDREAMAAELYKAPIPGGDARILNAVFESADDIQITSFEHQVSVDGYSAEADVRLHMRFRQSTTREVRSRDLRLQLNFAALGPGDWQLRRLQLR